MSSTAAKPYSDANDGNPKPKRPLSGYNLFYRYKRIKVVEATSKQSKGPNSSDDDNQEAALRAILTAPPGLEGVPSESPVWTLPRSTIDEIRTTNIRQTMEGKIFPSENARGRMHRKSHGMGFVEMGKTMREMWAEIDDLAKGVFCDLADVGRVRYRTLLADYQRKRPREEDEDQFKRAKRAPPSEAAAFEAANSASIICSAVASEVALQAPVQIEATPKGADEPSFGGLVSAKRPQSQAIAAVVVSPSSYCDPFEPLAVATKGPGFASAAARESNQPRYGRRVSEDILTPIPNGGSATPNSLDSISGAFQEANNECLEAQQFLLKNAMQNSLLNNNSSNPVGIGDLLGSTAASESNQTRYNRRVSEDALGSGDPDALDSINANEFLEFQQFVLKNAMHNSLFNDDTRSTGVGVGDLLLPPSRPCQRAWQLRLQQRVLSHNGMPPPTAGAASNQHEVVPSSGSGLTDTVGGDAAFGTQNPSREREASARDIMEIISRLDKTIDDNCRLAAAAEERGEEEEDPRHHARKPSFIFGKPVHDVVPSADTSSLVRMPAEYELKHSRARMA